MMLEIQVLAWDRRTYMAGLNRLMESNPSTLDSWISNGNTYMYKQRIKNLYRLDSTEKRPHTITHLKYVLLCVQFGYKQDIVKYTFYILQVLFIVGLVIYISLKSCNDDSEPRPTNSKDNDKYRGGNINCKLNIPHCWRNSSNIQQNNRRDRGKINTSNTHMYMTTYLPGFVQVLQQWRGKTMIFLK